MEGWLRNLPAQWEFIMNGQCTWLEGQDVSGICKSLGPAAKARSVWIHKSPSSCLFLPWLPVLHHLFPSQKDGRKLQTTPIPLSNWHMRVVDRALMHVAVIVLLSPHLLKWKLREQVSFQYFLFSVLPLLPNITAYQCSLAKLEKCRHQKCIQAASLLV